MVSLVLKTHLNYLTQLLNLFYVTVQKYGATDIVKNRKNQSRLCKRFCYLSSNTTDSLALGECGRLPIAVSYMVRCLTYWIKLLSMEYHR